jgi:hypothetical protein
MIRIATNVGDLDHRVDRGAGGVLVGIADGVARDRGVVRVGALAAVRAVLDRLLRVVPGAAACGHRDREEEAGNDVPISRPPSICALMIPTMIGKPCVAA